MNMTDEQKDTVIAFADAVKAERPGFMDEGVRQLDDLINHMIGQALDSVSTLEGEEEQQVKDHLINQMREYTRRGLQRAIKGLAKECDNIGN